ncbi:MAG: hypothetical protein ABII96_01975, partial [Candidatus Zixiibacteriota bacterium]
PDNHMNAFSAKTIRGVFLLFCIFNSSVFSAELITEESHGNRYFRADLVIFGEILTCTTSVIKTENVPGDSGWIFCYNTLLNSCLVRVDSVLKGHYPDSTIIIFNEATQHYQTRFERLDENGDSMYIAEIYPEIPDKIRIPGNGKWIIFLVDKDGACYFLWNTEYNKSNLDLYRKFEKKGESYFKEHPSEFLFLQ